MIEGVRQLAGGISSIAASPQTTLPDPTSVIAWQTFAGWQKLVIALWAVFVIGAVFALLLAITQLREAASNIPGQGDEAKIRAVRTGSALMALVGFGVILTTIFTAAS